MALRKKAVFYLNGERHEVGPEHAGKMLADYLRQDLALTGTKIVCAEGDCGACTLLRYFPKLSAQATTRPFFLPVNSCISTVAQMDGSSLVTVDKLSTEKHTLTPVQNAMMNCHGSQCGFCTPGFVMALSGLVEKRLHEGRGEKIQAKEAKNFLTGNLCRCTGYEPIVKAATQIDLSQCISVKDRFFSVAQAKELKKVLSEPLLIESEEYSFYAPRTLKDAVKYLAKNKSARILGAATDLGVVHNKYKVRLQKLLSLHLISELYEIREKKNRVTVGARVTLSELRSALEKKTPAFSRFIDIFASPQIKNVATLIGNIGNASPIGDTPPFFLAMDADVEIYGAKGARVVPLHKFYLGYRKTALKAGELITGISFMLPTAHEDVQLYKSSQRKDLDISAVNGAFRLVYSDANRGEIQQARIAMGGIAATPVRLKKIEELLEGKALTPDLIRKVVEQLQKEITPLSDLRGSAAFRRVLAENYLTNFLKGEVLHD